MPYLFIYVIYIGYASLMSIVLVKVHALISMPHLFIYATYIGYASFMSAVLVASVPNIKHV